MVIMIYIYHMIHHCIQLCGKYHRRSLHVTVKSMDITLTLMLLARQVFVKLNQKQVIISMNFDRHIIYVSLIIELRFSAQTAHYSTSNFKCVINSTT